MIQNILDNLVIQSIFVTLCVLYFRSNFKETTPFLKRIIYLLVRLKPCPWVFNIQWPSNCCDRSLDSASRAYREVYISD